MSVQVEVDEVKVRQLLKEHSADGAPATCSASERSADEWAAAARKAMNLAMDATEQGNDGASEGHRKTAQLCFEFERSLRQMQKAHKL